MIFPYQHKGLHQAYAVVETMTDFPGFQDPEDPTYPWVRMPMELHFDQDLKEYRLTDCIGMNIMFYVVKRRLHVLQCLERQEKEPYTRCLFVITGGRRL